jgi:hypothetical protein
MDHPLPWLRYLPADDLSSDAFSLRALKVRNDENEDLGEVDGVILDVESQRPYYLVVDAGGWFKSKNFLVPVGHTQLTADQTTVLVDLSTARINRFPGFDKDEFEQLSDDELRTMSAQICAISIEDAAVSLGEGAREWERADYATPDWWSSGPSRPDRMGESALTDQANLPRR